MRFVPQSCGNTCVNTDILLEVLGCPRKDFAEALHDPNNDLIK